MRMTKELGAPSASRVQPRRKTKPVRTTEGWERRQARRREELLARVMEEQVMSAANEIPFTADEVQVLLNALRSYEPVIGRDGGGVGWVEAEREDVRDLQTKLKEWNVPGKVTRNSQVED